MNVLTKIASRNIWRNKKRSLLIICSVSVGLWAGIFMIAFYNGMLEERVNNAITTELSHIQLHNPNFRKEYEVKFVLPNGKRIIQQISKNKEIKALTGRVIIKGMISSASGSIGITINGVLAREENTITNLAGKLKQGNYFHSKKSNEILISQRLSKKFKINLHKKAILTFQDKDGNLASSAFRVCGIYKTMNAPYDDTNVFVKITDVDALAGIKDQVNEIAILYFTNKFLDENQQKLKTQFPSIEILNWKEIAPELGLTVSVGNQMAYIFMGIILLALAFGIINTMLMSVLERTREIGMLLALGMNKLKIFIMIMLETFFLILLSCPIGIGLAFGTIAISHKTGINFGRFSEVYSSFGYNSTIHPSLTFSQFGICMLLIVVTAFFSALFPARRALKLNPAESLK